MTDLVIEGESREQRLNVPLEGAPFLVSDILRMRKDWLHRCDDALDVVDHTHCG